MRLSERTADHRQCPGSGAWAIELYGLVQRGVTPRPAGLCTREECSRLDTCDVSLDASMEERAGLCPHSRWVLVAGGTLETPQEQGAPRIGCGRGCSRQLNGIGQGNETSHSYVGATWPTARGPLMPANRYTALLPEARQLGTRAYGTARPARAIAGTHLCNVERP